jgi:S-formylglutathione hydrolase FrmB
MRLRRGRSTAPGQEHRSLRYLRPLVPGPSLEGNPLGSPAERELHVYLPPGYDRDPGRRYPVLYFLHGYGAIPPTIAPLEELRKAVPRPLRPLVSGLGRLVPTLETLDALILSGQLPPFLLVQPDGSLHRPHGHQARGLDGELVWKGSFFTDSPRTGRYSRYVLEDVVAHVDRNWRTLAAREGRALVGVSMGGYGALLGGILRPERFSVVAALSPVVGVRELLQLQLIRPYYRLLMGAAAAAGRGREDLEDLVETCEWVFGPDRQGWEGADLAIMAARVPGALRGVRLLLNCALDDEYALAGPCRRFAEKLDGLGLEHELEIYEARGLYRLSPHAVGIAARILPAIRFCLSHLAPRQLAEQPDRSTAESTGGG